MRHHLIRKRRFTSKAPALLFVLVSMVAGYLVDGVAHSQALPLVEVKLESPVYAPTPEFPCGGTYAVATRVDGNKFVDGDNLVALVVNSSRGVLRTAFATATRTEAALKVSINVCSFDARYLGPDETYTARITFVTGDGKAGQELLLNFNLSPRPAIDQARSFVQSACRQQSALFSVTFDQASLKAKPTGQIALRGTLYRGGVESPDDELTLWSGSSRNGRRLSGAKTDTFGRFELLFRPARTDLYFTMDVPSRISDIDGFLPVGGFQQGVVTLFPDNRSGARNLKFDPVTGGGFPLNPASSECRLAMSQYRSIASSPPVEDGFTSPKAEPIGTFKLITPEGGTITVKKCRVSAYVKKDGTKVRAHPRRCP
jgi:hypothetical protein